jgi:hypothetical protein
MNIQSFPTKSRVKAGISMTCAKDETREEIPNTTQEKYKLLSSVELGCGS